MNHLIKSIALVGIKHCGKSTHGKNLSAFFNCPFFDTDDEIIKATGKSAREIYLESGENAFKQAETESCANVIKESHAEPIVISTGGGICNNEQAIKVLKDSKCVFVFIKVPEEVAADRIVKQADFSSSPIANLPAYISKENPHSETEVRAIFHKFYTSRVKLYEPLADYTLDLAQGSKQANTQKLIELLATARAATSTAATAFAATT